MRVASSLSAVAHGLHNVDTLCFASSTGSDGLPPLPPREDYDVILFFSNGRFLPTEAADLLGDYLYEFVQDGKGVVQAVFSVCSGSEALGTSHPTFIVPLLIAPGRW